MAAATAPSSAIPIPGVGAAVDLALIVEEVVQYRKLFGLPGNDSEEFKKLDEALKGRLLRYSIKTAMKLAAEIASELALELGVEEVVKYIPIAGTILACAISATLTSRYLIRCINELEEVALLIMDTETARVYR
ncbi:Hypothetical predicted protein [Paramuricea clavata]|uniref:Uncharacterized protein n=1 Tax=Paramuricea clavata TaxID=317549 RepID=A0A6S7JPQ9_PARCT|nr:Hypothetical predicted protein [Paramuricea clavata]